MSKKLESITQLPKFLSIDGDTQLGAVPIPRTRNLREARDHFARCRVPLKIPPGKYYRTAHDKDVAILELIRYGEPWLAQTSWVTRTRNLLPRRSLCSRELPIEVAPQDLRRPCIHLNAPSYLSSLWRYMDIWKFESMLRESGIFLARSDLVNDPREASLSFANLRYRAQVYRRERKMARRYASYVRELPTIKRWTYISCWRVDENENERSWTEYADSVQAIAIKTTYRKLLERTATIFCAGVEYIDYSDTWVIETDPTYPFTYKARDYEWEREFRIVIQQFPKARLSFDDALYFDCTTENSNCGLMLRVDLPRLIDKIVVGPNSSKEFYRTVQFLAANHGLAGRVARSAPKLAGESRALPNP